MSAFLFVIAIFVLVIAFGVWVSVYLYKRGAIGRYRFGRSRRLQTVIVESGTEEENED